MISISQFTYDDLMEEIEQLKNYYFLSKKTWMQLLVGKVTEMVAGGIISETISKELINGVNEAYPLLLNHKM